MVSDTFARAHLFDESEKIPNVVRAPQLLAPISTPKCYGISLIQNVTDNLKNAFESLAKKYWLRLNNDFSDCKMR